MALYMAEKVMRHSRRNLYQCYNLLIFNECFQIGYVAQHSNKTNRLIAGLNTPAIRPTVTSCRGLKQSASCLTTSDLSDKPWYKRLAIQSNDKFVAFLGRLSPKAQKQYVQLVAGTTLFYYDAKQAYQLRAKIKAENLHLSDLDWRDIYIKKQISKDLMKVLPTLLLMCLPFVFYVILPILFFFPRPFLSDQFFTREQLVEYNSRFHQTRLTIHPSIVNQLVKKVEQLPNSSETQTFLDAMKRLDSNMPLDSRSLLQHKELFEVVLGFNSLPRIHLVNLCRLYSLKSFLLPSHLLRSRLNKTLHFIHAMDRALLRENLQGLSQQDLEKLCFQRGLNSNDVDRAVLASWLGDWIQLSTNLTEKEESLLAHAAVLLVKGQSMRAP
ncbi:LETM1 domain-containing protein 1-like [Amphiura filiformis]|uniref:LETM1 domain-containing protein 1-like n=1 Tax=Amphiura filiformis TaxID=82378 RepID=UPI003B220545